MVTLTQIIVFLGALDFVTLTDTNNSNVGSYETVAMSGVYFEEEESVDLYDGVGVLIYDIAKPSWLNQFPFFLGNFKPVYEYIKISFVFDGIKMKNVKTLWF